VLVSRVSDAEDRSSCSSVVLYLLSAAQNTSFSILRSYISPPRGGAISPPICTKLGEFVDLTDVVTPAKFGSKTFIGFSRPRGEKTHFPFRKQTAYITVPCAAALACDSFLGTGYNYLEFLESWNCTIQKLLHLNVFAGIFLLWLKI